MCCNLAQKVCLRLFQKTVERFGSGLFKAQLLCQNTYKSLSMAFRVFPCSVQSPNLSCKPVLQSYVKNLSTHLHKENCQTYVSVHEDWGANSVGGGGVLLCYIAATTASCLPPAHCRKNVNGKIVVIHFKCAFPYFMQCEWNSFYAQQNLQKCSIRLANIHGVMQEPLPHLTRKLIGVSRARVLNWMSMRE